MTVTLLCCCETWVFEKCDEDCKNWQMRFLRAIKGGTRDHIRNVDIRDERLFTANDNIKECSQKWFIHVYRMKDRRIPNMVVGRLRMTALWNRKRSLV